MKSITNAKTVARFVTAALTAAQLAKRRPAKTVTKKSRKPTRKTRSRRPAATTSITTYRKKKIVENHSSENRSIAIRSRARQPSALALARVSLEPQWYRVQGLSQYDTSVGFYPLANRLDSTNGRHLCPCHVWDITSTINIGGGGTGTQNVDCGAALGFTGISANSASQVFNLCSQNADGTYRSYPNTQWISENTTGGYDDLAKRKSIHHWTHVKMNLYGVRKRATKFVVQLVMIKDEGSDFMGSDTIGKRKLVDALVRPYIYNNLNSGDPQTLKNELKVLKTYEVTVAPTTTDEYGGSTAVPHIQTVNWFVEHNRVRRYDSTRADTPGNGQDAAFDQEIVAGAECRVKPTARVYLLVRALAPERRTDSSANWAPLGYMEMAAADPISEPSYDLVIRNKFSTPT